MYSVLLLSKIAEIIDGYTGCIIRRKATQEIAERRGNICAQCPFSTEIGTCSECGCLIRCKVHARKAECPKNKW